MVKIYEVDKEGFLNKFIELLSVLQNDRNKFTKKQTQILVEFLMLPEDRYNYTRFHAPGKKEVIRRMKEKYSRVISKESMVIFLRLMKNRGIITEDEDRSKYLSKGIRKYIETALSIMEPIEVTFRFIIKDGNNRQNRIGGEALL